MKAETWFTSSEALEAGLADRIIGQDKEDEQEVTAKWDLSFFAKEPRSDVITPPSITEATSQSVDEQPPVRVITVTDKVESGTTAFDYEQAVRALKEAWQ